MKNEKAFFAEKRLFRERFKVALEEVGLGKEKVIEKNFFSLISILYLDTLWYDDRY